MNSDQWRSLRAYREGSDPDSQAFARARERVAAALSAPNSRRVGVPRLVGGLTAIAAVALVVLVAAVLLRPNENPFLERAVAALSPPDVVLVLEVYGPGAISPSGSQRRPEVYEWVAQEGALERTRVLVSSGPPGAPPDDEDTLVVRDAATGDAVEAVSWTPSLTPNMGGELTLLDTGSLPFDSWHNRLREAIEGGEELPPAGEEGAASRVLSSNFILAATGRAPGRGGETAQPCEWDEIRFEPATMLPVEMRVFDSCDRPTGLNRPVAVFRFEFSQQPLTQSTRRLVSVGPWAVSRVSREVGAGRSAELGPTEMERELTRLRSGSWPLLSVAR